MTEGNVTNIEKVKGGNKLGKQELNMSENFELMGLIKEEYTRSGMNNSEFAAYAMTKVKLRTGMLISPSQVASRCEALGIENNVKAKHVAPTGADAGTTLLKHELEIANLKERILKLEVFINTTFPTVTGKKLVG